ncbi:ribonuclease p mrp subunit [Fusarium albosuccineum]|uniref:Ribonuclease p mrp subunit n=1 Tax=Fusarium albosuccineum TaxID=1237068 RepID=A0A8H4KDK8_9HYPO|nr:ribonuclease p mrp subunit [Fusarium albosuccineum]
MSLSLLYEPPTGRTVAADIVFVHGLGGGSIGTWSSGNTCWPRDILKEDIPQARIFSHGYDSKVYKSSESRSRTSIAGQADSLLHDLVRSRRTVKALVRSSEHHHSQQPHHVALGHIVSATTAVISMGTPHRGSSKATLGKIVAKAGKVLGANDRILKSLENVSAFLEQQRNSFDSIRRNFLTIVPEASACIDGPDILKEHLPGCDHKSMAKFNSRTDKGYTIVLDYLQQALETTFSPEDSDTEAEDGEEQTAATAAEIASQCILNSLEFDEIDHRFTSITDAHKSISKFGKSTYDWIFEDGKVGFHEWLFQSKSGLFWINGKAGSGKSTLMKFIANQLPSRIRSLRSDSGTDLLPLESASFFFWAAGTTRQKSHQGLFRTILYNLLSNHHYFVQDVFSKKWSYIYPMALEMCHQEINSARRKRPQPNPDTWHKRVLVNLKAQATHKGTLGWGSTNFLTPLKYVLSQLTSTRVLLLIDGLDEYDGSEDELDGLVALLQTWAQLPNIKICVSTRPWTVFEANFGQGQVPSLRLQDLTSNP